MLPANPQLQWAETLAGLSPFGLDGGSGFGASVPRDSG